MLARRIRNLGLLESTKMKARLTRCVLVALTALIAGLVLVPATATASTVPAVRAKATCDYYNNPGTWPLCEVWSNPVHIPTVNVDGPRPDLTVSSSSWCKKTLIQADTEGWVYWRNYRTIKHDLRFWPDYNERVYALYYWDGYKWGYYRDSVGYRYNTAYCGT